ncbi:Pol polyprotein, partial [Mucuna pruriens]
MDILGPFPLAPGQVKFLVVAVDYFTKWIEAETVASITTERIKRFFWKKIICRFGISAEIVFENGTQFTSKGTVEFCKELKIKQLFTSVKHPQSNGQAEAINKVILRGLRKRLEEAKVNFSFLVLVKTTENEFIKELPQLLWSYHTTPHSTTNETPFCLTFGTKAMIPVEIGEPSPGQPYLSLEAREIAHIKEYAMKTRAARKYNRKVVPKNFKNKGPTSEKNYSEHRQKQTNAILGRTVQDN